MKAYLTFLLSMAAFLTATRFADAGQRFTVSSTGCFSVPKALKADICTSIKKYNGLVYSLEIITASEKIEVSSDATYSSVDSQKLYQSLERITQAGISPDLAAYIMGPVMTGFDDIAAGKIKKEDLTRRLARKISLE